MFEKSKLKIEILFKIVKVNLDSQIETKQQNNYEHEIPIIRQSTTSTTSTTSSSVNSINNQKNKNAFNNRNYQEPVQININKDYNNNNFNKLNSNYSSYSSQSFSDRDSNQSKTYLYVI